MSPDHVATTIVVTICSAIIAAVLLGCLMAMFVHPRPRRRR